MIYWPITSLPISKPLPQCSLHFRILHLSNYPPTIHFGCFIFKKPTTQFSSSLHFSINRHPDHHQFRVVASIQVPLFFGRPSTNAPIDRPKAGRNLTPSVRPPSGWLADGWLTASPLNDDGRRESNSIYHWMYVSTTNHPRTVSSVGLVKNACKRMICRKWPSVATFCVEIHPQLDEAFRTELDWSGHGVCVFTHSLATEWGTRTFFGGSAAHPPTPTSKPNHHFWVLGKKCANVCN